MACSHLSQTSGDSNHVFRYSSGLLDVRFIIAAGDQWPRLEYLSFGPCFGPAIAFEARSCCCFEAAIQAEQASFSFGVSCLVCGRCLEAG